MPSTKRCVAVRGACHAWLGFCCAWLAVWLNVLSTGRAVAQGPPQGPVSQPVVAAEIVRRDLPIKQTFVGTVVPRRVSQVGSPVEGRVIELSCEEGDYVTKGSKLAQLRTESLEIDLASANAELELLQAELERLEVAGPEEIKQAKARITAAEALMALTKSRRDRGANLSTVISKDELDELASAFLGASSVLEERTIGWELAKATLPIDVTSAKAKVRMQEEKIRGLKDDIAEHTTLAPFDGYVAEEHTEVGQWIAKGGLVAEVVEVVEVDVELPVLETYVAQLRVRTKERAGTGTLAVEIEALPGETFEGDVVSIVPKANLSARTFPVNVRLKNRSGPNGVLLRPGMFARVTLPLSTIPDAVLVPKDALVLGQGTKTIWTIQPKSDFEKSRVGSAAPVSVATGESSDEWIQVRPLAPEGKALLQPGGLVIVEGNERVEPTLPVRVIETLRYSEQETSPSGHGGPDRSAQPQYP